MRLQFDQVKATQVAAFFLRLAGKPLNYMALIKMLYRADRAAIASLGLPITTDNYVSMKNGPVTSQIYNLIKASANANVHPTFWSTHIGKSQNPYFVALMADPGVSALSPAEERILTKVFESDGTKDTFELAAQCHKEFPEWTDPGASMIPIEISDIISTLGLSEEEAAHIEASVEAQRAAFSLSV